jgi:uncharacterized protein YjbJ (UPF0337 family)
MTEQDQNSVRVAGGGLGKAVGRVKEALGSAVGNDALSREGRVQQVLTETEQEAAERAKAAAMKVEDADIAAGRVETETRREQLEGELARERQEDAIEGAEGSALASAEEQAHEETMAAEHRRQADESAADAQERIARAREVSELAEAERLKDEARQAEQSAASIDPEGGN